MSNELCANGARPSRSGVAILLGTLQGERFLAQQLDTIMAQTYTDWVMWVSDDGSTDGTVGILEAYRAKWGTDRLHIKSGPARGFRANFLSLACDPTIQADYFAFCDQDDVWDADKLAVAVRWLQSIRAETPALYFARTRLIDEDDRAVGFSPLFPKPPLFENAIVQSIGGGNTMVFNRAARALLMEAGSDVDVQTHDWWLYMLVTGCGGKAYYDFIPKVGYRQHGQNLVGSNASWRGRFHRFRRLLKGDFRSMNDRNIAALQRMRHRLSPHSQYVFNEFARARADWLVPRVLGVRRSGVYGQALLPNLALIVATVLKRL